ncbi:MAG TPA: DUF3313 domain-containing protein [Burkholderiales bacterium]|jgi:hypothetical protein
MRSRFLGSFATVVIAAALVSCAAPAPKYSGYLGDGYKLLKEEKDPLGAPVLRFISPQFTPANYHSLIIERVQFYPEPKPDSQVSMGALNDIRDYLYKSMREKVGARVKVVDKPGPGVARIRSAITAVNAQTEALAAYQYIPIALIVTAAKRSAVGAPEDARIFAEAEVLDSVSGVRLAVAVREGTGERLKQAATGGPQVTLNELKPVIDKWVDALALNAITRIKAK